METTIKRIGRRPLTARQRWRIEIEEKFNPEQHLEDLLDLEADILISELTSDEPEGFCSSRNGWYPAAVPKELSA